MSTHSLRRLVSLVALIVGLSSVVAACSIPTEDQPQPVNREQSTTTVTATP
jgi:hypothetical protein